MATNQGKMLLCDTAAREQRVTAAISNVKRQSRSRHKKARDGSGSAPSSDDGCESPTVDKTKKAGEGPSNARTIDDSHKPPVEIERKGDKKVTKKSKKAGEGSSNARAVNDSHKPNADSKKAGEGSSNARAIADSHKPNVNIERIGEVTPKTKRAGEGSSNARAVDDGRIERREDTHTGITSSRTRKTM